MGDSIAFAPTALNTDYGAALTSSEGAINAGVQSNQVQATRDAFAHLDVNDPESTNSALSALVKAGAVDQANAVQNLNFQRYVIGQKQGAISGLDQLYGPEGGAPGGQPADSAPPAAAPAAAAPGGSPFGEAPAPMTPAQQAHAQAVMGFAKDSVDNLLEIKDPAQRAEAAQQIRAKAVNLGVPPQAVDAAIGDLSDQALTSQSEHYQAWLDHPSFGGQSEGPPPALHATTQSWASQEPSLADPRIQKELARLSIIGVNIDPMVKALQAGQGYTGVVAPGQSLAKLGQVTGRTPYAPVTTSPGENVVSPDTGGVINAHPLANTTVTAPMGTNIFTFNPNPGGGVGGDGAPAGGGGAPAGGGAASPAHPGYNPSVPAESVIAAATAHPAQYLSGLLGTPVQVTSTDRSPAHNAAVGGAPGSEHIPGNGHAIDFMPPAGMSHDQVAQKILASGVPFDQLIFEKNGSGHIGWSNGAQQRGQVLDRSGQAQAPAAPASGGSGLQLAAQGQKVSGLFHPANSAPGQMATQNPDGSLNYAPETGVGPTGQAGLQGSAATNPQVQRAQTAVTAYNALRANAGQMTGPAALSMLQAVSGVAGSPADVVKAMGLPQEWLGKGSAFLGKGPLTPEMQQQVMDAGYHALTAAYGQAAEVNAQRAAIEQRSGLPAGSTQAPLPSAPHRYFISAATLPPPAQRVIGQVYDGPNGPHVWSAKGWQAASR